MYGAPTNPTPTVKPVNLVPGGKSCLQLARTKREVPALLPSEALLFASNGHLIQLLAILNKPNNPAMPPPMNNPVVTI